MRQLAIAIAAAAMALTLPQASAQGKRILFIGDSVTDGNWGGCGAERSTTDMNHIFGHGFMADCAAHYMAQYPDSDFVFINRGISGNTVADLRRRWDADVLALSPDVVSVLVGINDAYFASLRSDTVDLVAFEDDYRAILADVRRSNPDVQLVVCQCFAAAGMSRTPDATFWPRQCAGINAVVERLAAEFGARLVPFARLFDSLAPAAPRPDYWIWDGIHPTPAAHLLMARMWMQCAGDLVAPAQ